MVYYDDRGWSLILVIGAYTIYIGVLVLVAGGIYVFSTQYVLGTSNIVCLKTKNEICVFMSTIYHISCVLFDFTSRFQVVMFYYYDDYDYHYYCYCITTFYDSTIYDLVLVLDISIRVLVYQQLQSYSTPAIRGIRGLY